VDRSIHAQLVFRDGLAAIADAGVPVYLAHGPEDPAAAWGSPPSTGQTAFTSWAQGPNGSP
jgi:hypothetical protein